MTTAILCIAALALAILIAWPMGVHTTASQSGHNTLLAYALTQAGTYVPIGLRVSIGGLNPDKEKIDNTNLDSVIMQYRDSGVPDLGEIPLNLWWDPGDVTHQLLETWASGPAPTVWFHITFNDVKATVGEFSGYVSKFERSGMEVKGTLAAVVTIIPQSKPTYTYTNPTA